MKRLVIFDFYNLLHRSYHAFPREMSTSKGVQTNAAYGFISSILSTVKELNPQYVLVASETGPSFRREQFKEYKATRTWRKEHPDVILLDLRMPKMDGMTMMHKLREDEWGNKASIIILTNLYANDERLAGVVADQPSYYLIKADTSLEKVLEKVRGVLEAKNTEPKL